MPYSTFSMMDLLSVLGFGLLFSMKWTGLDALDIKQLPGEKECVIINNISFNKLLGSGN